MNRSLRTRTAVPSGKPTSIDWSRAGRASGCAVRPVHRGVPGRRCPRRPRALRSRRDRTHEAHASSPPARAEGPSIHRLRRRDRLARRCAADCRRASRTRDRTAGSSPAPVPSGRVGPALGPRQAAVHTAPPHRQGILRYARRRLIVGFPRGGNRYRMLRHAPVRPLWSQLLTRPGQVSNMLRNEAS